MIKYIRWFQALTAGAALISWLGGAQWWALATAAEALIVVWMLTGTGKMPNVRANRPIVAGWHLG